MKKALKLLLVALLFASVSSVALAEVSIGGWGRGLFVPAASFDDTDEAADTGSSEIVAGSQSSWGGSPRIGFTVAGNSDNVGFFAELHMDNAGDGAAVVADNAHIWVSPVEGLRLALGTTVYYDALRGNSTYGSWDWIRPSIITGEDAVFTRGIAGFTWDGSTTHNEGKGGMLASYDANGIHAFVALDANNTTVATDNPYTTANMLQRGQYGFGYEIAGIGLIRSQYIGQAAATGEIDDDGREEIDEYAVAELAFKLDQLVDGLLVDVGGSFSTDDDYENHSTSMYVSYNMAPMTFHVSSDIVFNVPDMSEDANRLEDETLGFKSGFGFDFDLGNGLGLTSDLRFADKHTSYVLDEDGKSVMGWSAMAGVTKGFSNGLIGAAFQVTNAGFAGDVAGNKESFDPVLAAAIDATPGYSAADFTMDGLAWALPIRFEYWF